jgi:hypothetical protein
MFTIYNMENISDTGTNQELFGLLNTFYLFINKSPMQTRVFHSTQLKGLRERLKNNENKITISLYNEVDDNIMCCKNEIDITKLLAKKLFNFNTYLIEQFGSKSQHVAELNFTITTCMDICQILEEAKIGYESFRESYFFKNDSKIIFTNNK